MSVKIFGREPALVAAFLQAVLAVLVGYGIVPGLDNEAAGLVTAAGAAVFGAYAAYAVKESLLPALVAAFQALLAVAVAFGLDVPADKAALLTAGVSTLLGLYLRTQATPVMGSPSEPVPVPVVEVSNLGANFGDEPVGDSDRL